MGKSALPFVRSPYNYDRDAASAASGLLCDDVSLAVQSEADDADINVIVKRFGLTGELPQSVRIPMSGDFTGAGTYQEALEQVRLAGDAFMQFPADVRARFNHDPQKLIDFCEDPNNYDEAVKLGIANAPVPAASASEAPAASGSGS